MKIPYQINPETEVITMYLAGEFKPTVINREHPSYSAIYSELMKADHSAVPKLLEAKPKSKLEKAVDWTLPSLRDKGAVIVDGKLFINSREQVGRLAALATEMARKRGDIGPFLKFLALLDKNPSSKSKEEAYDFLQHKGLPIMENGMVRGYKGVELDNWSCTGNKNTEVIRGKVDDKGRIWNGVGEVIEVRRNSVDDDRNNACSHGLHIGTYEYASGFGQKLLLVEFSPEDIVSVPTDSNCQKLRCCKYTVLEEFTGKEAIPDTLPPYTDRELVDAIDVILDDDIPAASRKTVIGLKSYIWAELGVLYDELEQADFDRAIAEFSDELSDIVEEENANSEAEGRVIDVETRVRNYVSKKKTTTIGMIQKSLNPTKVGCSELSGIVKKLGFKVKGNAKGISNWQVCA